MKRIITAGLIIIVCAFNTSQAQEIRYGLRAGINIANFDGPSEIGMDGEKLETFSTNSGFHIGAGPKIELSEVWGVQIEILYSQKGTKQTFDGESFRVIRAPQGNKILAIGTSDIELEVTNSYIEIPATVYGRFFDRIEVFGGPYLSILVGSIGGGKWVFNGKSTSGSNVNLDLNLDYNFQRDEPGEVVGNETTTINIGGNSIQVPNTLGAYYDFDSDEGQAYETLEVGLAGGLNIFLNRGLYFGARVQWGLTDVSQMGVDYSKQDHNGTSLVLRDDTDKNTNIQVSFGFAF